MGLGLLVANSSFLSTEIPAGGGHPSHGAPSTRPADRPVSNDAADGAPIGCLPSANIDKFSPLCMVTQLEGNWAFGGFVVTACGEQCDESVLGDGQNERDDC